MYNINNIYNISFFFLSYIIKYIHIKKINKKKKIKKKKKKKTNSLKV